MWTAAVHFPPPRHRHSFHSTGRISHPVNIHSKPRLPLNTGEKMGARPPGLLRQRLRYVTLASTLCMIGFRCWFLFFLLLLFFFPSLHLSFPSSSFCPPPLSLSLSLSFSWRRWKRLDVKCPQCPVQWWRLSFLSGWVCTFGLHIWEWCNWPYAKILSSILLFKGFYCFIGNL